MKKNPKTKSKGPSVISVSDLSVIERLHGESFTSEILMFGKVFKFQGRRLLPREVDEIQRMMEMALPPQVPGEKPGDEPRYDFNNKEYLEHSRQAKLEARAYALWLGYPCFMATAQNMVQAHERAQKDGNADPDTVRLSKFPVSKQEIAAFIQSRQIDNDALQLLFKALTEGTTGLQAYVRFTSGNGSLKS